MPALNLHIPNPRNKAGSVELNEDLLRHWLKGLPQNNLKSYTEIYLDALKRFNQNEVEHKQRIRLLDMYRAPLHNLLEKLTIPVLRKNVPERKTRHSIILNLTDLMAELATGYKIVVVEAGNKNNNLALNPVAQLAINRACEQLGLLAVHAYKFYRRVPVGSFRDLHQLYLIAETSNVADKLPFVNNHLQTEISTRDRYAAILLMSISNPYGLGNGMIFKVYQLMQTMAALAEILPMSPTTTSTAGYFYLNCLSDRCPTPTVYTAKTEVAKPPILILNTKPVLIRVDKLFEQKSSTDNRGALELLRLVVPYLNTSYQRKQPRLPVTGIKRVSLAIGLKAVHQTLTGSSPEFETAENRAIIDSGWEVLNKNSYGYLVTKPDVNFAHDLKISDFIGIVESDDHAKNTISLASIRWLRTDEHEFTKLGVKFIEGIPTPVHCFVEGQDILLPALLLPESTSHRQPASIITTAGTFHAGTTLHIKTRKKLLNFSVVMHKLLEHNNQYERFTFLDNRF